MGQAIKYQETEVSVDRSIAQITALIRKYGGSRFEVQWNAEGNVDAIRFAIATDVGEVPVFMRARTEKILKVLRSRTRMTSPRREDQSHRIAWRHMKDLVEQLLLSVELGLKDLGSAFMDDVEVWDEASGRTTTVGEYIRSRARAGIAPGQPIRLLSKGGAS